MRPDRTSTTKTLKVFTSRALALSGLPKPPARPTKLQNQSFNSGTDYSVNGYYRTSPELTTNHTKYTKRKTLM